MALDGGESEAAEVVSATAWKGLGGEGGDGGAQNAQSELPGIGGERIGAGRAMLGAEETVAERVVEDFAGLQRAVAEGAMREIGQKAHQARDPELEVRQRHPGLDGRRGGERSFSGGDAHLLQDGEKQPEGGLLRIALGQRGIEQLGKKN